MKEKRAIQWIAPETAGEREKWKRKKTVNLSIYSLIRAIDGVRTRDPDLGKVVLYQLSHYRVCFVFPWNNIYYTTGCFVCQQLF